MMLVFDEFELDSRRGELRQGGAPIALEPQVYSLLLLLIENRDRLISRDEIIEKVWEGRIVSDSALASRIKALRAALGDDGKTQRYIRTSHGRGYRFVAEVRRRLETTVLDAGRDADEERVWSKTSRPSLAVLPFRLVGVAGPLAGVSDALPQELIAVLARLRWLFVIAWGTAFRFRPPSQDVVEIGAALGVRYCLTGVIELLGGHVIIAIELSDVRNGGVIWGERFAGPLDDVHEIRERITIEVAAALEVRIPLNEAQAARLKPPESLDAWSAYHLGLQALYRFNRKDNEAAVGLFERAVAFDPGFARAHAGLASAHFQNAFQKYTSDRRSSIAAARRYGERSIELDPLDPFANFAMGRVHWLEGDLAGGASWLDRSVSLSPNYAQGLYARAWANSIAGIENGVADDIELALSLSPLDPFRYAMLGVRAFDSVARGDFTAAAHWSEQAARAPGAHALIAAIAVAMLSINGENSRAASWANNVRARKPGMTLAAFFEAFPFQSEETRRLISEALARHGF